MNKKLPSNFAASCLWQVASGDWRHLTASCGIPPAAVTANGGGFFSPFPFFSFSRF
jgi:hypothetical protein